MFYYYFLNDCIMFYEMYLDFFFFNKNLQMFIVDVLNWALGL